MPNSKSVQPKAVDVKRTLEQFIKPEKAAFFPRFFKAGKGEYGEGDKFIGVMVPDIKRTARTYQELSLPQVRQLLRSKIHEYRSTGVAILIRKFERAKKNPLEQELLYEFMWSEITALNNWDLVDTACPKLLGVYWLRTPEETPRFYEAAQSLNLWQRRIAMIGTYPFIKSDNFEHPLAIAEILVADEHDLIHKAVGWMLREIGNRSRTTEEAFLKQHAATMPRTMLRYAIEKFPETKRKYYLNVEKRHAAKRA